MALRYPRYENLVGESSSLKDHQLRASKSRIRKNLVSKSPSKKDGNLIVI